MMRHGDATVTTEPDPPAEMRGTWIVARVVPQHEKAVAADLATLGIQHYLPLIEFEKVDACGKPRKRSSPLFGGYLFVCHRDERELRKVEDHRSVYRSRFIHVIDQTGFARELACLWDAMEKGWKVQLYPHAAVGRECRIKEGPYEGAEGPVLYHRKHRRIVMMIHTLNTAVEITVEGPECLEAA